jgi:hypothetical protein
MLANHLAAVDAAKAAPAEMEDAGDPAAVWADNEAPLAGALVLRVSERSPRGPRSSLVELGGPGSWLPLRQAATARLTCAAGRRSSPCG